MTAADHPLHVDRRGRTAGVSRSGYLRDLVEQVLFTNPGERVMRPTFGAGVAQLLFEPAGPEVAATTRLLVQSSLQQWLGDLIDVDEVDVYSEDGVLAVRVAFTERLTQDAFVERFLAPAGCGMSPVATTGTVYRCGSDERQAAVRARPGLNGIEYVELVVPPGPLTKLPDELLVVFLKPVPVLPTLAEVVVTGGEPPRAIPVVDVAPTHDPRAVRMRLARPGDLSDYRLRLVTAGQPERPLAGIDPVLSGVTFSFGVVCESELDCAAPEPCPPPVLEHPPIDRLAKDYGTFRRVLFDRLALLQPDWNERNPADVRTALVEMFAYVGDQLSYQQDAVATEAYLGTARRRISVRRHARLVDYAMHDGMNARTWVQLRIGEGVPDIVDAGPAVAAGSFVTDADPVPGQAVLDASDGAGADALARLLSGGALVFEVVPDGGPASLSADHNRMTFHPWSGERCCLPPGATRATLAGHLPNLAAGDVVILAEHRSPATGETADADPGRRHPVRLVEVEAGTDVAPLVDPATLEEITEIAWDSRDALPFSLAVGVEVTRGVGEDRVTTHHGDAAVVLGNLVLVDHGRTIPLDEKRSVPDGLRPWRPRLAEGPVSQASPPPAADLPATAMRTASPADAVAAVRVTTTDGTWESVPHLLDSGDRREVVAEIDDEGVSWLRFGRPEPDGTFRHGRPPTATGPDQPALIRYRVGNGPDGNIGPGAITRTVATGRPETSLAAELLAAGTLESVGNPLPSWGGTTPESIESVRQRAPFAFNRQERAVTAEDYAQRAEAFTDPLGDRLGVQRAVATMRWTGSWYTVFIAVDRAAGVPISPGFERRLRRYLEAYRMAGVDVEIEAATYVALEVELRVGLAPTAFRAAVLDELGDILSNRRLPDGGLGLFHPDRLTFGQTVYLSPIVTAVQAVPGVAFVDATCFSRYRLPATEAAAAGFLTMGRSEIALLDNDPSRPERGVLRLVLEGGR